LPDRRQALRVGRRPDRGGGAARTATRRRARGAGDGRLHARSRIDLQRRPTPGGGAGRGRRGSADPCSGDRGRPSTLRAVIKLARIPGVVLVAVAAAMWGTDPLLRKSILSLPASTIVFGEHVFLVLLTLPLLLPALRTVRA